MSNQGNVVFIPSAKSNFPKLTFRTGRWSGGMMHSWVKDLLAKACGLSGEAQERDFLWALCHTGSIEFPIVEIGNEDVPTMVISFEHRTVAFVKFTYGNNPPETMAIWPLEQFLAEPSDTFRDWYE